MMLRRFAHRRGWLWSPSCAWSGARFGKHGYPLLPVNERHRALVVRGHEQFNEGMRRFLGES